MILKNLSRRSSIHQLFTYVFEKERKTIHHDMKSFVIKHNVRSRSLKKWVKEFEQNAENRIHKRKDNIKLNHAILSFSPKDSEFINEKVFRDIAKKFIELRGQNNMYVGNVHYDANHLHIHILYSAVEYHTGKSNRISREDFRDLKKSLDEYQRMKYPELENSLPDHNRRKSKKLDRDEYQRQLSKSHQSQKLSLIETLEKVFSKSTSIEEIESKLKAEGHQLYFRNDSIQGIKFNGERKFRFSRLGDYQEKITELSELHSNEKRSLESIQTIRQNHSSVRSIQSSRQNHPSTPSRKNKSNDHER